MGGLKWLPGKTPVQAEGVTVNAWSYDWIDPEASLKDGYKLINSCDTYLYIVPSAGITVIFWIINGCMKLGHHG